ncbi:MAG: leucine-rich repeat domain-containing protein [Sedimentisphaerales bacterium]|nr:leucine-rich repeat domain-containing protein [Sedimentisphaerales bacterium]
MKGGIVPILMVLGSMALAQGPVYIPDDNLKAAIEAALGMVDPTPSDMLGLTSLDASLRAIKDLTGLEYAKNLQYLDLSRNNNYGGGIYLIDALSGLVSLEYLDLNNNYINDLSPIAGCKNLRYLDIHDNKISDISVLSDMVHLETAYLYRNKISDISVLSGLSELRLLHLHENQITDLSPLLNLRHLEDLNVLCNPLSEQACLEQIPQIMANNPGISIVYPHCGPPRLVLSCTKGGVIVELGSGVFTYPFGQLVLLRAKADPGFVFAGWKGTYNALSNPVFLTMDQDHQIRAHFVSCSSTIYVDDNAPGDPAPESNEVSDGLEDGTESHPFDSIQEAIDVAADGASVLIRPGSYYECIEISGKSIQLVGTGPNSIEMHAYPRILGKGYGPVITISRSDAKIKGLVISRAQGFSGEALVCTGGMPTIEHCLIVGNRTEAASGAIIKCKDSSAQFIHCTITENVVGATGSCVYLVDSQVLISHCIVWGNVGRVIGVEGSSRPEVRYTDITGLWEGVGNLSADPLFARAGRWVEGEGGVIWEWGDYHLRSGGGRWDAEVGVWQVDEVTSPCIDAGDPGIGVGYELEPNGGRVNLGAYGGTTQASRSPGPIIY